MMNLLFCALLWAAEGGVVDFAKVTQLEAVPEDGDVFMEEPRSVEIDASGNFYIVDAGAAVVFKWDKAGMYVGTIGKPGSGPGEFQFSGRGPSSGFIAARDKKLYVLDPPKNSISVFGEDGTFQNSIALNFGRGMVLNFGMTESGDFLVHRRGRKDEGVVSELIVVDKEGKKLRELKSMKDDTFKPGNRNAGRRFTIKAYNPTMVSDFGTKELLLGFSGEPTFDVVGLDGSSRTVKVPLLQTEVSQADKDEYEALFANRNRKPAIEFPEKKAYYTHLLSLGDAGYLVYEQSPMERRISGLQLAKDGSVKGRFTMTCGQQGGLYAVRGRLLSIALDEDDEFQIHEVKTK